MEHRSAHTAPAAAGRLLIALALAAAAAPATGQESGLLRTLRAASSRRVDADGAAPAKPSTPRVVVELLQASARAGPKSAAADGDTHFYVGTVRVGHPQPQDFSVLFDTAAGNLVLPSWSCRNASCLERQRYSQHLSASSTPLHLGANREAVEGSDPSDMVDVINMGFTLTDLGDGEVWGGIVKDTTCIGTLEGADGRSCAPLGILAATEMDEGAFWGMPADGMLGLGLEALTVSNPLFSLPRQLATAHPGMLPQFSVALRGARGELAFGGPSAVLPRSAVPTVWRPVVRPEDGYWQVHIQAVRVGNKTIDSCQSGCRGIVDASASRLGVPVSLAPALAAALAVAPASNGGCQGPRLHFDLGGGAVLSLRPEDYAGTSCKAARLSPFALDPPERFAGVFVFGESLLKRYDTAFDWGAGLVGFSPVAPWAVRLGPPEEEPVEVYQV